MDPSLIAIAVIIIGLVFSTVVLVALAVVISGLGALGIWALIAADIQMRAFDSKVREQKIQEWLFEGLGMRRESGGLVGTVDGVDLQVRRRSQPFGDNPSHRTDFSTDTGISDLQLTSRISAINKRGITVGEPKFDGAFHTECGPEGLRWLSPAARYSLLSLTSQGRVRLKDGVLTLTTADQSDTPDQAAAALRDLASVTLMLQTEADLAERMRTEPLAGVRWRMLEALSVSSPSVAHTEALSILASSMADPSLRLQAALITNDVPTVMASIRDEGVDETLRWTAANAMTGAARCEGVALLAADPTWWTRAVGLAVGHESTEMTEVLLGLIQDDGLLPKRGAMTGGSKACEQLVRALAKGATPAVPDALIQLLQVEDDGVRTATLQSLGEVGDVEHVAALRSFVETLGAFDGPLKRRVEQTIAQIQARSGGGIGELSVVDVAHEVGAVSVVTRARPPGLLER